MRVLKATEGEILNLAFSPDGRAVAAAIAYCGVFLWNLEAATPTPVRLCVGQEKYLDRRSGLTFSPDGRSLTWLSLGARWVYNRDARSVAEESFAVTRRTHGVAHNTTGQRVVSQHGPPDHFLIGWRPADGEWIQSWKLSTADLSAESMTLSADGEHFAMLTRSALGNRWWDHPMRLEVRDAATATIRLTAEYPSNHPARLLFSPDAGQLVGFKDMTLLVWTLTENAGILAAPRFVRNDTRKHFTATAFHPNCRQLFATSNDTTVHVFDTRTWARSGQFTWRLGRLKAITVSPDGTLAAAGGDKGDIVIWDID